MKNILSPLQYKITRRGFIRDTALLAAALSLPRCASFSPKTQMTAQQAQQFDAMNPIDRRLSNAVQTDFSGDHPELAHRVLRDNPGFVAAKKLTQKNIRREKARVVVIGGGVSGLTSAYFLRDYKPILLEQCARLGGNAKGQSWQGIDYNIGSAYIATPEKGSRLSGLMNDLDLTSQLKSREGGSPVALNGEVYPNYWKTAIANEDRGQTRAIRNYCTNVLNEVEGLIYPDIPIHGENEEKDKRTVSLDAESFKAHIERVVGGALHRQVGDVLEQYCWSSFAASASEISAAAGLNFFASEFGPISVMPGGNATFTEALAKKMFNEMPAETLRPQSLVAQIETKPNGVEVLYIDRGGELRAIDAERVVFAAPKFVAKHVIRGLSEKKENAMAALKYRSYLVANVLLNKPIPPEFYDLFMIKKEAIDTKNMRASVEKRGATDLVFANYATGASGRHSVLSLFKAMPYDGGRGELFASSYAKIRKEFETQVQNEIASTVGFTMADVADIRVTRHGHPLPVASRGLIHEGTCKDAHAPVDNRVFFVNQDNWALPAFETGYLEAEYWTDQLKKYLA